MEKPSKPTPDFPLFPHASGQWAKKIKGKAHYFGPWSDPQAALARYQAFGGIKIAGSDRSTKPSKPYPGFPLYAHATGQWAKKVKGKVRYFGPWADPDGALAAYNQQKDDLLAGRVPTNGDGLTLQSLVNRFLSSKQTEVDSGDIKQRTWNDYYEICEQVLAVLGNGQIVAHIKAPEFERLRTAFAKNHGPVTLFNAIGRARVLFNYASEYELIDRPLRYGKAFAKPSRAVRRRARAAKGRMLTADQIRDVLNTSGAQLRAMAYLGINCGLGNYDCEVLTKSCLDLDTGWLVFPRPKTGIMRRCPLWPETVEALQEAIARRPKPKDPANNILVFITKYGQPWSPKSNRDNPIANETTKVFKKLGFWRKGLSFYALRHTFQTIGGKSRDKDAVQAIMGHADKSDDMSSVYDEEPIEDARLLAVTTFVRRWVFEPEQPTA